MQPAIGLYGGTFDPVHHAHLRLALEVREALGLAGLRFVPCHVPALRAAPGASGEQRRAMLELAIRGEPGLSVDDRELRRSGPSYTIDTLASLRAELGPEVPLVWLLGADAWAQLPRWRDWQRLTDFAHLAVLARPGAAACETPVDPALAAFLAEHRADPSCLRERAAGGVWFQPASLLDISASAVRAALRAGRSARYWLPEAVLDYIARHGLYRPAGA